MRKLAGLLTLILVATSAQAAWVKPVENLACTLDLNEWGYGSSCACPEATRYSPKIGQCLSGEAYPIMVSGILRSSGDVTLDTEFGTFDLVVKTAEAEKLARVDGLYFEAEGEFLLIDGRATIVVDRLSWLD